MQIQDIIGEMNPEMEAKFADAVCRSLKGTVKLNAWLRFKAVAILALAAILLWTFAGSLSGIVAMLLVVAVVVGGFVMVWYALSWKLEFDGETGWLSYHSLFENTTRFHISEVTRIWTDSVGFFHRGRMLQQDLLYIRIEEHVIKVTLRAYLFENMQPKDRYFGCDRNADKLWQYLDLYQRFFSGEQFDNVLSPADEPKEPDWRMYLDEPLEADRVEKTPELKAMPEVQPQEQAKPAEAEPSDVEAALPPKKEVDVDALFNSVLREHGRERKPARKKGLFRR